MRRVLVAGVLVAALTARSSEVPEREQVLSSGAELRGTVPAGSEPAVAVDGQVQQAGSRPADGDRLLVTVSPQLPPGPHVLTVAAVRADGLVVADAVPFSVS